jgi:hypothetical protein
MVRQAILRGLSAEADACAERGLQGSIDLLR